MLCDNKENYALSHLSFNKWINEALFFQNNWRDPQEKKLLETAWLRPGSHYLTMRVNVDGMFLFIGMSVRVQYFTHKCVLIYIGSRVVLWYQESILYFYKKLQDSS